MFRLVWPVTALSAGSRREELEPACWCGAADERACNYALTALKVFVERTFSVICRIALDAGRGFKISGVARSECRCG